MNINMFDNKFSILFKKKHSKLHLPVWGDMCIFLSYSTLYRPIVVDFRKWPQSILVTKICKVCRNGSLHSEDMALLIHICSGLKFH